MSYSSCLLTHSGIGTRHLWAPRLPVLLNRDSFAFGGTLDNDRRHLLSSQLGEGVATGTSWVEGKEAVKDPPVYREALHHEELGSPKCQQCCHGDTVLWGGHHNHPHASWLLSGVHPENLEIPPSAVIFLPNTRDQTHLAVSRYLGNYCLAELPLDTQILI